MELEVIKTDKQYRTRLFAAYAICIVVIFLAISLGVRPFRAYMDHLTFPALMNVSEIVIMCAMFVFVGPACYLIVIGRRIISSQRMPYPGQKVIHDTKVITGKRAVLRGRLLLFLGIFGICIALAGAARSHYLIEKFRHFNPFENWKKGSRIAWSDERPPSTPIATRR